MLCERVLDNIDPDVAGARRVDPLDLNWRDCYRRAVRGRTRGGVDVGVMLPLGTHLRHGDVLFDGDEGVVVANVLPCEVWVAEFADARALATAALELGNHHVPVEVAGAGLVCLPDGPVRGVFDRHAKSWRREFRRFRPLRATVVSASVQLSPVFRRVPLS